MRRPYRLLRCVRWRLTPVRRGDGRCRLSCYGRPVGRTPWLSCYPSIRTKAGCPSGQWEWTVNPSRKLRRFESFTCHHVPRGPLTCGNAGRGSFVWAGCDRVKMAVYGCSPGIREEVTAATAPRIDPRAVHHALTLSEPRTADPVLWRSRWTVSLTVFVGLCCSATELKIRPSSGSCSRSCSVPQSARSALNHSKPERQRLL